MSHSTFSITLMPAREGDCLWIEYGDAASPHRVLFDMGRQNTYAHIRQRFEKLSQDQREFELLVISHIDRDHIEGALAFFADPQQPVGFKEIWFNGYRHLAPASMESFGVLQAEALSGHLKDLGPAWNRQFNSGAVVCDKEGALPVVQLAGGLKLTLVSPTRAKLDALEKEWASECLKAGIVLPETYEADPTEDEAYGAPNIDLLANEMFISDTAVANGSSIAFIAEFEGVSILLAADAHPDVLIESLGKLVAGTGAERVRLDAVKVSHHGSSHNTSNELLALIDCPKWLVSTNGSYFKHPSPSTIARLIKMGNAKEIVFNYRSSETAPWDNQAMKSQRSFTTRFPDKNQPGEIKVELLP
ncbi:hypothetical protein N8H74_05590 [Pseudomonas sp. B2M1-30]|uniref:hypothetical protein n=1 Tax=Pseudomonas TaxID=286 RepID=UPI0021C661AD|nr:MULTISPECIES: hypothetical protein [Pseudomonas]MCU0117717.1 hypothetical protein [Pseudomonas sp. B2M1-30]MCU7259253.1 hypothetical protein [Pseudomonas koreensis]